MSILSYDSLNLNKLRKDMMDEHSVPCTAASGVIAYVNLIDQRHFETDQMVDLALADGYDMRRYLD